jgi:hypothetical protein
MASTSKLAPPLPSKFPPASSSDSNGPTYRTFSPTGLGKSKPTFVFTMTTSAKFTLKDSITPKPSLHRILLKKENAGARLTLRKRGSKRFQHYNNEGVR